MQAFAARIQSTVIGRSLRSTPVRTQSRGTPFSLSQRRGVARSRLVMAAFDPSLVGEVFFLDSFAQRQWDDPQYSGTTISFDKAEFTKKIHEFYASGDHPL
eukprot:1485454-Pyramimonas_sp.AAC.3